MLRTHYVPARDGSRFLIHAQPGDGAPVPLVVVSNCPQVNNPCNGFDPTPVRMIVRAEGP